MDPAYQEIGPNTCVGMTGAWSSYSWPPAIILVSVVIMFLLDFAAERYVEIKYGITHANHNVGDLITGTSGIDSKQLTANSTDNNLEICQEQSRQTKDKGIVDSDDATFKAERSFRQQIAAFIILEFGIIFHSVVIGLNLGTSGREFATLYPVIVFHQSFEGLGIGARMSAIPFPKRWKWLQWTLCSGYGLTTPIAIAAGLGVRNTYNSGSFTANIVSGVFDSISAGVLIYTGLVELLARDFLFNPERTMDNRQLTFMVTCTIVGAGVMALLGKWA
jgi:solute carrier family 39 (zinc transporter), member 1/2/3